MVYSDQGGGKNCGQQVGQGAFSGAAAAVDADQQRFLPGKALIDGDKGREKGSKIAMQNAIGRLIGCTVFLAVADRRTGIKIVLREP